MYNGTSEPGMIARRYLLRERLGAGGMGEVYRATDKLNGKTLALKRVIASPGDLAFASKAESSSTLLALATEFRTLSTLRHPNIISVIDYGFDELRRPYFTMEYLPEAGTILQAGRNATREEKLHLILSMLQALVYLHRRGILHRDLKPGNVLVSQGQLKVVDFGLSMEARTRSAVNTSQSTAGTLAYMAPELFQGEPVSRASDLYAVGVIAYELLVGHHPFNISNIALLINEILNKKVDVYGTDLDPELARVLEHLLAKEPERRANDAGKVILELCQAAQLPLPPETEAIREGFLQSAKFVGRKAELAELGGALEAAMEGRGCSLLISGESGVGKSRLLDELRTLALVKGAVVLRGQAVSEGGRVYQIWRDMLPFLCILTDMDDAEASILKPLVPNISSLVGREISDPPPADPQMTQNRLFALVVKLFQRMGQPLVIVLEDLQWAGTGSIGLFNHLNREVPNLPLLLIGSYRGDETPHLPERIPGVKVLQLSRLDDPSIRELSVSILGETGRHPEILDLLRRETEGIPFFLVEVVRALAEQAGELGQIDQHLLPEKILSGGVEQVIERRLNRVPKEAYELLQMSAILGRELDLKVLATLHPETNLELWLGQCANAAVLEVQENRWRFNHDKLREYLLDELDPVDRPVYHERAAQAVENTYSDRTKYYAKLAYLWQTAGHEDKELYYAEQAGQQELANSVYVEGIRFLKRALDLLLKRESTPERSKHELRLLLLLGPAYMNIYGQSHPIVTQTYSRAAELGHETQQHDTLFRVLWGLCVNAFVGGNLSRAQTIVQQLFDTAEQSGSEFHRLEANHAGWTTALWQGRTRAVEEYFQDGFPIYDQEKYHAACVSLHGHDTGACGQSLAAMNLWIYGYPDRARQRAQNSYDLGVAVHHPYSLAFGLLAQSMIGFLRRDLRQLERWSQEFLHHSYENKYNLFMAYSGMIYGWYLARLGRYHEAIQHLGKAVQVMHEGKTYAIRPLVISSFMEIRLMADQIDEGIEIFKGELEHYPITGERIMEPEIRRVHGELLLSLGRLEDAEREFQLALQIARKQEGKSLELRSAMSLGRLWQAQNRPEDARRLLAGIRSWFTEGFETGDLQEADSLLKSWS
jgi:tetratricopeptide (TPR) repeat protein